MFCPNICDILTLNYLHPVAHLTLTLMDFLEYS